MGMTESLDLKSMGPRVEQILGRRERMEIPGENNLIDQGHRRYEHRKNTNHVLYPCMPFYFYVYCFTHQKTVDGIYIFLYLIIIKSQLEQVSSFILPIMRLRLKKGVIMFIIIHSIKQESCVSNQSQLTIIDAFISITRF